MFKKEELENLVQLGEALTVLLGLPEKKTMMVIMACMRHADYLRDTIGRIDYKMIRLEVIAQYRMGISK